MSKQSGSGLGQPALRRLLSAAGHAPGCPKQRPVGRLGRAGRPHWALVSIGTWFRTCTSR
eukprot:scaffold30761_cov33-Phaeocystis_antarctica.AAC.1